MGKSLEEYADWLDEREDVKFPRPPRVDPPKAAPYVKPLRGIRVVLWDVYGALLRIADGELLVRHPQELRMEIALDKTIKESTCGTACPASRAPPGSICCKCTSGGWTSCK